MGDDNAPRTSESMASILRALEQNYPGVAQSIIGQIGPIARAQQDTAAEISPRQSQLALDLLKQFGPQFGQIGSEIESSNRLASAQTDADILSGPGRELVSKATELDRLQNPEFYATRELAGSKVAELLNANNLDRPNVEAERLVNQENIRSGNLANPSATNTVSNALQFGNERQKRVDSLSNAINTASGLLSESRSEFNPVVTALGRPSSNAGLNEFQGVQKPGNESFDLGSTVFNQAGTSKGQENDINANKRDVIDRINESVSSL